MIKLLDLNIEGNKHLSAVTELVKQEQPDLICFQEVFSRAITTWTDLGYQAFFCPVTVRAANPNGEKLPWSDLFGNLILSRPPILNQQSIVYSGLEQAIPVFPAVMNPNALNRCLSVVNLEKDGQGYLIATTHFTWADQGGTNDLQQQDLPKLLTALAPFDKLVLCGDFNAPRGGEIFSQLAAKYLDNIPPEITTTIDPNFHRAGALQLVVDGIFSQGYQVTNVQIISGVSDHQAVVCQVN